MTQGGYDKIMGISDAKNAELKKRFQDILNGAVEPVSMDDRFHKRAKILLEKSEMDNAPKILRGLLEK